MKETLKKIWFASKKLGEPKAKKNSGKNFIKENNLILVRLFFINKIFHII